MRLVSHIDNQSVVASCGRSLEIDLSPHLAREQSRNRRHGLANILSHIRDDFPIVGQFVPVGVARIDRCRVLASVGELDALVGCPAVDVNLASGLSVLAGVNHRSGVHRRLSCPHLLHRIHGRKRRCLELVIHRVPVEHVPVGLPSPEEHERAYAALVRAGAHAVRVNLLIDSRLLVPARLYEASVRGFREPVRVRGQRVPCSADSELRKYVRIVKPCFLIVRVEFLHRTLVVVDAEYVERRNIFLQALGES